MILALLTYSQGVSQNSLHKSFPNIPDSNEKVDSFNEACWTEINKGNWETAETYIIEANKLADALNYELGKAESYMMSGIIAQYADNEFDKAEFAFIKAFEIRSEEREYLKAARACINLFNLYKQESRFEEAIKRGEIALELLEKGDATEDGFLATKARLYNSMGEYYLKLSQPKKALKHYQIALDIRKKLGLSKELMKSYLNLGNLYFEFFVDLDKVEDFARKGLELANQEHDDIHQAKLNLLLGNVAYEKQLYEKALAFYQKVEINNDNTLEIDVVIASKNRGGIYLRQGELNQALAIWLKIEEAAEYILKADDYACLLSDIGDVYRRLAKKEKAFTYLSRSKEIADTLQVGNVLIYVLNNLGTYYYDDKQYKKALITNQLLQNIQDSITGLAESALIYKADLEESQKDKLVLEKYSMRLNGLLIITGLVFIAILLAFYAFFNKRKKEIAWQETDNLIREQELNMAYARLEGRNHERERVARDLHDGLGGMLATVKLQFAPIEQKLEKNQIESMEQFNKAFALLDASCDEVRRISHNLVSSSLKDYGLKFIVEELADHIRDSKQIAINVDTYGMEERLDEFLEIKIYRVVQELMSNILKHAKAEQVDIQLNQFDDVINVVVEDNGVGFNVTTIKSRKRGIGLENIDKRIQALDGKWNIDSVIGRGTTVIIDIPVKDSYE
jgi:two-component system NarL family sensor kinase